MNEEGEEDNQDIVCSLKGKDGLYQWVLSISNEGIRFNKKDFPLTADEFATAFVSILEQTFSVVIIKHGLEEGVEVKPHEVP